MQPETRPVPEFDPATSIDADERLRRSLQIQQRRLGWIAAVAVGFWSLAVVASVGVLVCFAVFYAPKEKQMLRDYGTVGHIVHRPPTPGLPVPTPDAVQTEIDRSLGVHFTMNWAMTRGILAVALSVVVLSCGTLATLVLAVRGWVTPPDQCQPARWSSCASWAREGNPTRRDELRDSAVKSWECGVWSVENGIGRHDSGSTLDVHSKPPDSCNSFLVGLIRRP